MTQEHDRIRTDIAALMAETMRLNNVLAKAKSDRWWPPILLTSAAFAGGMVLAKLLLA